MGLDRFQIKGAPVSRVVYPAGLFEKQAVKGTDGEPKYNAFIIIPKSDEAKVKQVTDEYMKAFEELRGKGFTGKTPKAINPKNNCFLDGDEHADEKDGREAFRGYHIIKVASKNFRPIVTDMSKRIILNGIPYPGVGVENISDETLNDGDYVIANISFWTYNEKQFQGIGANVHAIAKYGDGERIGGASNNVDDYLDMDEYK
jgi:hypothetical protein